MRDLRNVRLTDLQVIWGYFVALYGEVSLHSTDDGGVCLHLGPDEKCCPAPNLWEAFGHGVDRFVADIEIEQAAERVGRPEPFNLQVPIHPPTPTGMYCRWPENPEDK